MLLEVGDRVCIVGGPEEGWMGEILEIGAGIVCVSLVKGSVRRWFSQENCHCVDSVDMGGEEEEHLPAAGSSQDVGATLSQLVSLGFVIAVLKRPEEGTAEEEGTVEE